METLKELLKDYNPEHVEKYASYCERLKLEKNRDGTVKNLWAARQTNEMFANYFKRVAKDGLVFDGVHITLQNTGISYDYIAYKNKMLLAYPDSKIDVSLVYEGDTFECSKKDGKVTYFHIINSPFDRKDEQIQGGYCVIRNPRGEFLTILNKEDFLQHRKVAKTDFIWKSWYPEMCMKTLIKKACKQHFADIYERIDQEENTQNDLDNPLDLSVKIKGEIDALTTRDELEEYYQANKGKGAAIEKYLTIKLQSLKQQEDENS